MFSCTGIVMSVRESVEETTRELWNIFFFECMTFALAEKSALSRRMNFNYFAPRTNYTFQAREYFPSVEQKR